MQNVKIRNYATSKDVFLWEIAKRLGYSDTYFSKMLREEFSEEMKKKTLTIIDEIAASRDHKGDL